MNAKSNIEEARDSLRNIEEQLRKVEREYGDEVEKAISAARAKVDGEFADALKVARAKRAEAYRAYMELHCAERRIECAEWIGRTVVCESKRHGTRSGVIRFRDLDDNYERKPYDPNYIGLGALYIQWFRADGELGKRVTMAGATNGSFRVYGWNVVSIGEAR